MIMRSMFAYFFQKNWFLRKCTRKCVSKAQGGTKLEVRVVGGQISTFLMKNNKILKMFAMFGDVSFITLEIIELLSLW